MSTRPTPRSITARDDAFGRFRRMVQTIEPLTEQAEAELYQRYAELGDRDAAEQLVLANLRTVVQLAMRYHARLGGVFDLVQEGSVGLLRALDKYDPSHGVPFSMYARYWIRAMILRYVMENQGMVRVGNTRHGRKVFFELARERARLMQAGAEAGDTALAARLGVDPAELKAVGRALAPQDSLEAPDGGLGWQDRLPSDDDDPETTAIRRVTVSAVRSALSAFAAELDCARERVLLDERLLSDDPVSLATLGRRFGVTRERMRQLEKRLKERLRAFLLDEFGADIAIAA